MSSNEDLLKVAAELVEWATKHTAAHNDNVIPAGLVQTVHAAAALLEAEEHTAHAARLEEKRELASQQWADSAVVSPPVRVKLHTCKIECQDGSTARVLALPNGEALGYEHARGAMQRADQLRQQGMDAAVLGWLPYYVEILPHGRTGEASASGRASASLLA